MASQLPLLCFTFLMVLLKANPIFFPQESPKYFNFPAKEQRPQLPAANANLNIFALPVGQGDCTVVQCPARTGGHITIVDIGSTKVTGFDKTAVIDYLSGQVIDYLFLTHSHKDHINYVEGLFDDLLAHGLPYPPVYHSCPWSRYNINIPDLNEHEITRCSPCETYKICDDTVDLKVLASELNNCPTSESPNRDSIVIQVVYQGIEVFLPGDFEGSEDLINYFLASAGNIKSKVMRLSHHGANNGIANTEPFLRAVSPIHAFSSSGLQTNYGHPRCSLYDTLINILPIQNVPLHEYTCYNDSSRMFSTFQTQKSIFTTTIGDPSANPPQYINYVICYSIDSDSGGINVDITQLS